MNQIQLKQSSPSPLKTNPKNRFQQYAISFFNNQQQYTCLVWNCKEAANLNSSVTSPPKWIYNPIPRTKNYYRNSDSGSQERYISKLVWKLPNPWCDSNGSCQYMISKLSKTIDPCWQEEPAHYSIWIYILGGRFFFASTNSIHIYIDVSRTL